MTLAKLIKELQRFEKRYARTGVMVEWGSFQNSDWSHSDVVAVDSEVINLCDGDGYFIQNQDGSERQKLVIVLRGRK